MSEQFLTWEMLGSYSGTLGMVLILTQLTKELPVIKKIPTRLYCYLISVIVMVFAAIFSGSTGVSELVLVFFNAAIVALSANGGYDALNGILTKKNE